MCNCRADIKTIIHYLFHWQLYSVKQLEFINGVFKLDFSLQSSSENPKIAENPKI